MPRAAVFAMATNGKGSDFSASHDALRVKLKPQQMRRLSWQQSGSPFAAIIRAFYKSLSSG
jgi:hypothetical protein